MATELGKAYVQIVASAEGLGASIANDLGAGADKAGQSAGNTFGSNLIGTIKKLVLAAGIGQVLKSSIMEGANLEQSLGGVEAIFGDAAETVKQNAQAAFATAGVSANQYMEGVTSFAASLLQSTGGNTQKAADVADRAFRDMSDNANRFGTDIGSIQAAYQGFAKQNYTMLDNLKLGYGGTKTEMERLLKDAQALSGVEYNIDNLADVYSAIGVIQDKLNVTGTTAKEAASTFSGSFGMMKAAAQNLLGNLAIGENVGPALEGLTTSVIAFAQNALRLVGNIIKGLPQVIATAVPQIITTLTATLRSITTSLTESLPGMLSGSGIGAKISEFANGLATYAVDFIQAGLELLQALAQGVLNALPDLVTTGFEILNGFVDTIIENLPQIIQTGTQLLLSLVDGITSNLPTLVQSAIKGVISFIGGIAQNLPQIIEAGFTMLVSLAKGLINAIPQLVGAIPGILRSAKEAFLSYDWLGLGKDIIRGIVRGITNLGHLIADTLRGLARSAWQAVKSALGIGSPSKVFAKEVGQWIPAGIASGIEKNAGVVTEAMDDIATLTTNGISADLALASSAQAAQLSTAEVSASAQGGDLLAYLAVIIELLKKGKVININGKNVAEAIGTDINDFLGGLQIRESRGAI